MSRTHRRSGHKMAAVVENCILRLFNVVINQSLCILPQCTKVYLARTVQCTNVTLCISIHWVSAHGEYNNDRSMQIVGQCPRLKRRCIPVLQLDSPDPWQIDTLRLINNFRNNHAHWRLNLVFEKYCSRLKLTHCECCNSLTLLANLAASYWTIKHTLRKYVFNQFPQ